MFGCCRLLAAAAVFSMCLCGCSEQSTDGGTVITDLEPVTGLAAYSAGPNSVGLVWRASPSGNTGDMLDHQVLVRSIPADSILANVTVPRIDTSGVISGLAEGVTYRFDVVVRPTPSATEKGASSPATIHWAPARRIPSSAGGSTIRVYESASASFPTGLIIFGGIAPKATFLQNPSPLVDTLLTDLYLFTVNANTLVLRSAHLYPGRSLPRMVRFSSVSRDANSLDDPAEEPPDSSTYTSSNSSVAVTGSSVTTSRIHFLRSADALYARLLLVRQTNGTLIGGASPDRFVELAISYQTTPYQHHARRR